jgi:hypothetical protein
MDDQGRSNRRCQQNSQVNQNKRKNEKVGGSRACLVAVFVRKAGDMRIERERERETERAKNVLLHEPIKRCSEMNVNNQDGVTIAL